MFSEPILPDPNCFLSCKTSRRSQILPGHVSELQVGRRRDMLIPEIIQWTSIAEVNVYTGGTSAPAPAPATFGSWGLTIDFPLVPVSAAIEVTTGHLLVWSSWSPSDFHNTNYQTTITASYDSITQLVSEAVITNVGHDMFCE